MKARKTTSPRKLSKGTGKKEKVNTGSVRVVFEEENDEVTVHIESRMNFPWKINKQIIMQQL